MRSLVLGFLLFAIVSQMKTQVQESKETDPVVKGDEVIKVPLGLPSVPWPKDNPYSDKKAELGKLLYFDKRLSSNHTISCATCHAIKMAFTDQLPVSKGINGHHGTRNAPTVINAAYLKLLFWDGRANSLEEQCKGPLSNPKEMTDSDNTHEAYIECRERIRNIQGYNKLFEEAFGTPDCTIKEITEAIATFERTVLSGNSRYDRYKAGDKDAMNEEEIQGYKVFKKVGCMNCHRGPNFSDERFHNIGVGMNEPNPDLGRYEITKNKRDWGAFRTPILRDVENTYPYMHDGSLKTLEDVIEYYDVGGIPNKNLHPLMKPLHLSDSDKKALVSFLKALNGEGWQHFKEPEHFPEDMSQPIDKPPYLYKIYSLEDWEASIGKDPLPQTKIDKDFFHLATEEQVDSTVEKFFKGQKEVVIVKLDTGKLKGELSFEANPGGTNKYYHLYQGSIPRASILEVNHRFLP